MSGPGGSRRVLTLLVAGQMSVWSATFLSVFFGPFAILEMTGTFALGGLPFAMYYLSNLIVVVPAGRLMDRLGRAPVLGMGFAGAAAGAGVVAGSLLSRTTAGAIAVVGFLSGLFLLSAGSSIAFLTRVAVADLYPPEERGKGLGRILVTSFVGTCLGAAAFVALSIPGDPAPENAYLAMLPFLLTGAVAMTFLGHGLPKPPSLARPSLVTLLRRPRVGWAVTSNAGAQSGMGGVMSFAGPVLAPLGGPVAGAVLLSHFGGMFLPSPVAGVLADRVSRALVILLGGIVLATGALLFGVPGMPWVAGLGLFLVGAGWCLTFIPGTAILADAASFGERGSLFGANDAIVSIVGATVTVLAGFAFNATQAIGLGPIGLGILGAACGALASLAGAFLRTRPTGSARPHRSPENGREKS